MILLFTSDAGYRSGTACMLYSHAYDALMCIHVVLQDAPDFMTRNSVALSLFLMALRQAAITCALGFPTAEKRTKEMLTQNW